MAAELRGLEEVGGGGRSDQAGPRRCPQPSPGCGDVSLLSKCNMLNKAPLLPLAQAALEDTLLPWDAGWELMHCQFSQLEWPKGHPGQAAQCTPHESSLVLPRWPIPPWSQARTHRPPRVRVHRRGRPPGLRPHLGGRRGKTGRGGRAPTPETADLTTPAPCRPTLWPRLPGIPALTPAAPGPAGALVSQLRRPPPVSKAPRLSGLGTRHRRNNGRSRRQRGDGGGGDRGGKGSGSGGGSSGGDGVCAG